MMTPLLLTALSLLILLCTQAFNIEELEFSSGVKSYDAAFSLALTEVSLNIENGVFIAGNGWKQLWTRDTSYAVELAAGLLYPEISKASLKKSIQVDPTSNKHVWLQDVCGHFGGWPNLSDAIVGARGAWSLYCITGDDEWLSWAYDISKNSLQRAERHVYDTKSGLFKGCSSFMESDSGYPAKYSMNGTLVGMTKALSTNMLHHEGYKIAAKMGKRLNASDDTLQDFETKAQNLRQAIRSRLWSDEYGYYSYFEDEDGKLVPQMEGLGESLALLGTDFELDADRITSIFENTPRTKRGIPSLWPRFVYPKNHTCDSTDIACYYHNGRLWPFVSGYWALAAARHGQVQLFAEEFKNMVWLSRQKATFAEFYELEGTFPFERRRQLWSDTGFLSLVFYGLFGLDLKPYGIEFHPIKPPGMFAETISLRGLRYRNMTLDIHVTGWGSEIASIKVNEHQLNRAFVPAGLKGSHSIKITLESSAREDNASDIRTVNAIPRSLGVLTAVVGAFLLTKRRKAFLRQLSPRHIRDSEFERLTQ